MLLVIAIFLLFFISMTSVFLLRVFFAGRRTGRGRTYGATNPPLAVDTSASDTEEPTTDVEPAPDSEE